MPESFPGGLARGQGRFQWSWVLGFWSLTKIQQRKLCFMQLSYSLGKAFFVEWRVSLASIRLAVHTYAYLLWLATACRLWESVLWPPELAQDDLHYPTSDDGDQDGCEPLPRRSVADFCCLKFDVFKWLVCICLDHIRERLQDLENLGFIARELGFAKASYNDMTSYKGTYVIRRTQNAFICFKF